MKTIIMDDIKILLSADSKINRSYISYVQNQNLSSSIYFNRNQMSMITKLNKFNIKDLHDLAKEFTIHSVNSIRFEVVMCYNSLPREVRTFLSRYLTLKRDKEQFLLPYKLNIWKHFSKIESKDIRHRLKNYCNLNVTDFLSNKHNIAPQHIRSNPFSANLKITKETRLQDAQYKMLHNVYPTVRNLFKWRLKDSDNCSLCQEIDNLKHTIYDCSCAAISLSNFYNVLSNLYSIQIQYLSYENVLLGTNCTLSSIAGDVTKAIDTILILIKRKLILTSSEKYVLTDMEIEKMIKSQIKLENKTTAVGHFKAKWKKFLVGTPP